MADRDELRTLAERVMALTGPCLATDSQIWRAIEPDGVWWDDDGTLYKQDPDDTCAWAAALPFTASLDAAMTLVPDDAMWRVGNDGKGGDPADYMAEIITAPPQCRLLMAAAATPALAMTAAALLALAEQVPA